MSDWSLHLVFEPAEINASNFLRKAKICGQTSDVEATLDLKKCAVCIVTVIFVYQFSGIQYASCDISVHVISIL